MAFLDAEGAALALLGFNRFSARMFPEKIMLMVEPGFVCRTCGQTHEGVPLSFAADFPDMYANMSESDRGRALISSDQCIVDEASFFIRGCLEILVLDSSEVFIWGLWALGIAQE